MAGFKYDKSQTIFRIWSPVIKEINIIVENDKYELSYLNNGYGKRPSIKI